MGKGRTANDDSPTGRNYDLHIRDLEHFSPASKSYGPRNWGTQRVCASRASFLIHVTDSIFHLRLLDDLERNVDQSENKLGDAMRRMRKLLRDSEEKGSGYCIIFLIIILLALLLAVILV